MSIFCPCGQLAPNKRPLHYTQCCEPFVAHFDDCPAPDALTLMRSRYSAYALGCADYLMSTWQVAFRPHELVLDREVQWLGLEVRRYVLHDHAHATVEFVARSRDRSGRAQRMHETSRFIKDTGRWFYETGELK